MMRRKRWIDVVLAALIFASSVAIAMPYLHAASRRPYFFDWELVPATMMACGRGFNQPSEAIPALIEFVAQRVETFDCSAVPAADPMALSNQMARGNRYGLYGPMLAMWVGGVSWASLDWYMALLFGFVMAASYALMRLVASIPLAVLGTLVLAASSKLLEVMGHRDFIKEPPFVALLAIVAWMVVRPRTPKQIRLAAAGSGILLGVGVGCRVDVAVFLPFVLVALLIFVPRIPAAETVRQRVGATAVFLCGFALTATPILWSLSGGSNTGHHLLLGFMSPFTNILRLTAPVYDVGHLYSDGYAYTMIAAQARVRERDLGPVPFGLPPYDRAGARLDLDIIRQFPADAVARGYAAIWQALEYPFSREGIFASRTIPGFSSNWFLARIADWRADLMGWFVGYGAWLSALAVLLVAAVNIRLAAFCALAVAYFCGYSMLQFQRRHTFHLDLFSVLAVVALLQMVATAVIALVRNRGRVTAAFQPWRCANRMLLFASAVSAVVAVTVLVARAYQQGHVRSVIETTLAAVDQPLAIDIANHSGETVIISSSRLGERIGPGPVDDVRDVRMEYAAVTLAGEACGTDDFPVTLKYVGESWNTDKVFDRTFQVSPRVRGEHRLLAPIFYEFGPYPVQFAGVIVPRDKALCLTELRRASHPGDLPFPFLYAALGPNWRDSRLYQVFPWE